MADDRPLVPAVLELVLIAAGMALVALVAFVLALAGVLDLSEVWASLYIALPLFTIVIWVSAGQYILERIRTRAGPAPDGAAVGPPSRTALRIGTRQVLPTVAIWAAVLAYAGGIVVGVILGFALYQLALAGGIRRWERRTDQRVLHRVGYRRRRSWWRTRQLDAADYCVAPG